MCLIITKFRYEKYEEYNLFKEMDINFISPLDIYIEDKTIYDCLIDMYEKRNETGDVSIEINEYKYGKVHKFIVVALSEYFKRMFRGGFLESKTNVVNIEEEYTYFNLFIEYLYFWYDEEEKLKKIGILLDYFDI